MLRVAVAKRGRVGKSELETERFVPYVRHVDERTVALDSGAVMRIWRLDGLPAESLDQVVVNQMANAHNHALRAMAHERCGLWTHLVRLRQRSVETRAVATTPFVDELVAGYEASLAGERLYKNTFYVSLVVTPEAISLGPLAALWAGKKVAAVANEDVEMLADLSVRLEALLKPYGVASLGIAECGGTLFSEPSGALRQILTGREDRVPLTNGDLGRAVMSFRPIFGRDAVEIREAASSRYVGMVSIGEYPARTRLGMLDSLGQAPCQLVMSQSFKFLSRPSARALMTRRQNQMASAGDLAVTQAELLTDAVDRLESGEFCFGQHHMTVAVIEKKLKKLPAAIAQVRRILSDAGMLAMREDLSLIESWFAQLPGNFKHRVRRAEGISSQNFAAMSPYHSFPVGRTAGVHWGAPVTYFRTSAASRYAFNYHVRDVGHALILGATGAGKSVLLNFTLAGLHRLGASIVLFDKDRGAEVFVGVNGGTYLSLRLGKPSGAAPFKAMDEYTDRYRTFLAMFVQRLVEDGSGSVTADDKVRIEEAIRSVERMPLRLRGMDALRANLGGVEAGSIGRRLQRWCRGGELGWVLDCEEDVLPFELGRKTCLIGFDLSEILRANEAREPLLMYFFERLDRMVDGRRLVWAVEEFHAALNDPTIRRQVDDALRVWRRRNGMAILVSQNPADAIKSEIGETLLQQTPTKIYLPNPSARKEDYVGRLNCLEREFELIQSLGITSRKFLMCQRDPDVRSDDIGAALTGGQAASVLCDLDLGKFEKYLRALSPQAERGDFARWDKVRASGGDAAALWARFCAEGGFS
jgi:type IV secretion system protein VirB4